MTSKEALKRLKQETAPATYMVDFDKDECIEIIRKDLERLEELEEENDNLLDDKLELVIKNKQQDMLITKLIQENTKLKQVIEILKSHIGLCNFEVIHLGQCVKDVRALLNISDESLSLEEYELLGEVFNR